MYIGTETHVVGAAAIKRQMEQERFVWDDLNAGVGTPWKPTPTAQQASEEALGSTISHCSRHFEEPWPALVAVRGAEDPLESSPRAESTSVQVWTSRSTDQRHVPQDSARS